MTRGILIAGNESLLFSAAAGEAGKRVEHYATAMINSLVPSRTKSDSEAAKGRMPIIWNPASSISSRTLVTSAENCLGQIDEAILVCSPPSMYCPAEALVPSEVEAQINNQIKGWFFLVRELALYFRTREKGTLALVVPEKSSSGGKDYSADLLGASAAASFRALTQGLLSSAANEPFIIQGFTLSETGQEKEFSQFLFKHLDEASLKNSGKWFKFNKLRLF